MLRKTIPLVASLALAGTGALTAGSATAAPHQTATFAAPVATKYALSASGYSTRVVGGNLNVNSGKTAFQIIGCTNKAGLDKTNFEAQLDAAGLRVSAAKTHVWTTKRGGTVSSYANNHIAKVSIAGGTGSGTVFLRGINSRSRAWHDAQGFHASTKASLASIALRVGGVVIDTFPVPTRGNPTVVPGIATIALGQGMRQHDRTSASAMLDALRIRVIPTNTTVYLAHSRATIRGGVKSGLFGGSAYGTKVNLLNGTLKSGPTPFIVMPCLGTNGEVRKRSLAAVGPVVGVRARALTVSERATATRTMADAYEKAHVARLSLGKGLVVTGINARAHAHRMGGHTMTDARGTSVARVTLNGRQLTIPASGVLRVQGIAKLETRVVKRTRGGIQVTALRVTLLDGRGAVVNVASAKVRITPSGL